MAWDLEVAQRARAEKKPLVRIEWDGKYQDPLGGRFCLECAVPAEDFAKLAELVGDWLEQGKV